MDHEMNCILVVLFGQPNTGKTVVGGVSGKDRSDTQKGAHSVTPSEHTLCEDDGPLGRSHSISPDKNFKQSHRGTMPNSISRNLVAQDSYRIFGHQDPFRSLNEIVYFVVDELTQHLEAELCESRLNPTLEPLGERLRQLLDNDAYTTFSTITHVDAEHLTNVKRAAALAGIQAGYEAAANGEEAERPIFYNYHDSAFSELQYTLFNQVGNPEAWDLYERYMDALRQHADDLHRVVFEHGARLGHAGWGVQMESMSNG